MKHVTLISLLLLLAGCGGYDREVLGDPEPRSSPPPAATASQSIPAPVETAEGDYYYTQDAPEELDVGLFADLRYYGSWHIRDPYGWVWRPIVGIDWSPYMNGHWAWTEYGWMWVSYEPFGWATYHYGSWLYDFALGWVWVPDYEWSASRVEWIVIGDDICWCPIAPPGYYDDYPYPWWDDPHNPWVNVPCDDFTHEDVGRYRRPVKYKQGYTESRIRRGAPEPRDVERWVGRRVGVMPIRIDRRMVDDREFALVELPPDQQQIVDSRQGGSKSGGYKAPKYKPLPAPVGGSGGGSAPPPAQGDNSSTSKPKPVKSEPVKAPEKSKDAPKPYKEKDREEREEKAKGESKSKGKGR